MIIGVGRRSYRYSCLNRLPHFFTGKDSGAIRFPRIQDPQGGWDHHEEGPSGNEYHQSLSGKTLLGHHCHPFGTTAGYKISQNLVCVGTQELRDTTDVIYLAHRTYEDRSSRRYHQLPIRSSARRSRTMLSGSS